SWPRRAGKGERTRGAAHGMALDKCYCIYNKSILEVTREATRRPECRGSDRRRMPHVPLAHDESRADGDLRRGTAAVSPEVEPTRSSGGGDEGGPRPTHRAGQVSLPG